MTRPLTDWETYWQHCAPLVSDATAEAFRQVGKTEFGVPVPASQLDLIVASIGAALELTGDDRLVDLGCGNGVVTCRLCAYASSVEGVDASAPLIHSARRYFAAPNCRYHLAEMEDFVERVPSNVSKILMYEVAQHLSFESLLRIVTGLAARTHGPLRVFVGSIPDLDRVRDFYDTPKRWRFYEEGVASGKPHLGRWWTQSELTEIARSFELRCRIVAQDPSLYTAGYRFDALLFR